MTQSITTLALAALASAATAGAPAPQRDVQFRAIDLDAGVVEVHNFGAAAMPLDGWRFCSHSDAQARRYTAPAAFNGVALGAGESMFIHMNNDAPAGALNFDAADLGSFASNFGQGPYAIQFFWPNGGSLSFASTDDMVDHIQWSVNGVNNPVAATRSQQAVNAGLWTDAGAWVATSGNSVSVTVIPAGGDEGED